MAFNVTPSLSTNGQDVILRWNKSKDPEGDVVTYAVVYKDTLVKNLSDTTYTIKNLPFETEIKAKIQETLQKREKQFFVNGTTQF